ncbi:MAG TPA: FkbM family methyltransferase [Nitrosopumilaceae archaeon]|nr:FkbM family methyltransferase [Nitrosopumilaceae archaeon]
MQKNKMRTIRRACAFINRYRRKYGIRTAFRVLKHYGYRAIKNHNVNPDESMITVNGCKMIMIPNDPGISTELSIFKSHEPLNTKIISQILKKGMTCIDIGGNIGYYVLLERQLVGEKGKIIAIEPLERNFQYLKRNVQLQNFENIQTFNFACGDKDGKVTFFINKKSNGCKVIAEGETPPSPSLGTLTEVSVKILDTLVEDLKLESVDFVRMDAEGYELHILKGLKKTLEKFKPIISIELHKRQLGIDGTKEFFELMRNLGYEIESYVPRELDIPLIGTMKDVKKITIDELLKMIEKGKVENYLMLNLINSSKKLN